jgi:hypothetical protein
MTSAESVMRSGLVALVQSVRAYRPLAGSVSPESRARYEAGRATARAELIALIESVRETRDAELGEASPQVSRSGLLEIRTAHDLAELAVDPRVPIEEITALLQALEARDDDREPVAIFGA